MQRHGKYLICLDPGHGGGDPGAPGSYDVPEKTVVLAVALRVKAFLEDEGHKVLLTRNGDNFISLPKRASFANRYGADIFLSIHANASTDPCARGAEVLYHPASSDGLKLASAIMAELGALKNVVSRGVKPRPKLCVLRKTLMPAVLVECAFLSNEPDTYFDDEEYLLTGQGQDMLAHAIVRGVLRFFRGLTP